MSSDEWEDVISAGAVQAGAGAAIVAGARDAGDGTSGRDFREDGNEEGDGGEYGDCGEGGEGGDRGESRDREEGEVKAISSFSDGFMTSKLWRRKRCGRVITPLPSITADGVHAALIYIVTSAIPATEASTSLRARRTVTPGIQTRSTSVVWP